MYRITEIAKTGGRLVIRVSSGEAPGEEKYVVAKEFISSLPIEEGDLIGEDELSSISRAADLTSAASKALDVLSYSNLSRQALTDKLRLKYKIERSLAEDAADYAVRRHYIDEDAQAKKIAEAAVRTKMWGARRIAADLAAKGYPRECAERAAASVGDEKYGEALRRLIEKKGGSAPSDKAGYNKLIASLVRLGHSPSDIKAALRETQDAE